MFRTVNRGVYTFAVLGIILITSPKWTELAVEIAGFKMQINQLKAEAETLSKAYAATESQRVGLQAEVARLHSELAAASQENARDWATVSTKLWQPANPEDFKAALSEAPGWDEWAKGQTNFDASQAVVAALKEKGLTVIEAVGSPEFTSVADKSKWFVQGVQPQAVDNLIDLIDSGIR